MNSKKTATDKIACLIRFRQKGPTRNLAQWDPRGVISHDVPQADGSIGNDEASMAVLERMALGWDWIGDELTEEGTRFDWLLHALESMRLDEMAGRLTIRRGKARLAVHLVTSVPVEWSVRDVQLRTLAFPG
jgi:hypothetical protein